MTIAAPTLVAKRRSSSLLKLTLCVIHLRKAGVPALALAGRGRVAVGAFKLNALYAPALAVISVFTVPLLHLSRGLSETGPHVRKVITLDVHTACLYPPPHQRFAITGEQTMRATQVVAPRTIQVIDVPKPEMAPGKVLIRTVFASICGSDMPSAMGVRPESAYPMAPGRPGHEIVGVVEDSDADGFTAGERVLDTAYDGGMKEFHVRNSIDLIPLPNDRPLEEMLMAQPLGTVLHAAKKWPSVLGWDTVVIGQGAIGLFFTSTLNMLGARRVIAIDVDDFRLGVAKTMGATHTLNPEREDPVAGVSEITDGRLADMVVEASGREATYNLMTPLVRRSGYITIFGLPKQDPTPMWMAGFIQKEPTIFGGYTIGIPRKEEEFILARDLILQGRLKPAPVITHFLPIEEVQRGFEMAESHEDNAIKIVFRF